MSDSLGLVQFAVMLLLRSFPSLACTYRQTNVNFEKHCLKEIQVLLQIQFLELVKMMFQWPVN